MDLLAEIRTVTVESYETLQKRKRKGNEDAVHKNESRLDSRNVARGRLSFSFSYFGFHISVFATIFVKSNERKKKKENGFRKYLCRSFDYFSIFHSNNINILIK